MTAVSGTNSYQHNYSNDTSVGVTENANSTKVEVEEADGDSTVVVFEDRGISEESLLAEAGEAVLELFDELDLGDDGELTTKDLLNALNNDELDAETKAFIALVLSEMEQNGEDSVSKNDLLELIEEEGGDADAEYDSSADDDSPDSSIDNVLDNFDDLETMDGGGAEDGIISKGDLEAALDDPDVDPDLKDDIREVLELMEEEGLVHISKEGLEDMKEGEDDGGLPENPEDMTDNQARDVLLEHFDDAEIRNSGGDRNGELGKGDLETLVEDPTTDPHLREAAERLLEDGDFRTGMETDESWVFTKESITDSKETATAEGEAAELMMERFDFADTRQNGGMTDGNIGHGDLQAIIDDPTSDPALADAAELLQDKMEREGDDFLTRDDLQEAMDDVGIEPGDDNNDDSGVDSSLTDSDSGDDNDLAQRIEDRDHSRGDRENNGGEFELLRDVEIDQLLESFEDIDEDGDGVVSLDELEAAIEDGDFPPELKDDMLDLVETMKDEGLTEVSEGDLKDMKSDDSGPEHEILRDSEIGELLRAFDDIDEDGDGKVTLDELEEAIEDGDFPPELKDDMMDLVQEMKDDGVEDVSKDDLRDMRGDDSEDAERLSNGDYEEMTSREVNDLMRAFSEIDEDGDGEVTLQELEEAIESGDFSESEVEAMKDLVDHMKDEGMTEIEREEIRDIKNDGLEDFELEKLLEAFSDIDEDGDGMLAMDELMDTFKELLEDDSFTEIRHDIVELMREMKEEGVEEVSRDDLRDMLKDVRDSGGEETGDLGSDVSDSSIDNILDNFADLETADGGGAEDGIVSKGDLEAALEEGNLDPELADDIRELLDHMEAEGIVHLSKDELEDMKGEDDDALPANPEDMTDAQALEVLLENFDDVEIRALGGDRDDNIGENDLRAIADDEKADPHLREAAERLLEDDGLREAISENGDGKITPEAIEEQIDTLNQESEAASVILEHFDSVEIRALGGDRDGIVGQNDLREVIEDPLSSPELKEAAQAMLDKMETDGESHVDREYFEETASAA